MNITLAERKTTSILMHNLHNHNHEPYHCAVVPLTERLHAHERFTGRGVRIAFLDSGFYPHDDLRNRIAAFHDVSGEEDTLENLKKPQSYHWHGTQTTVVAAGSGSLSEGTYRGIASEAELVLIKVSENRRITENNIARGLEWVLANREKYNIRVLNISFGGDENVPCCDSRIDKLAEECVRQGIVVVAAAGNSAYSERPHSIPPANAPSVITVGGYADKEKKSNESSFTLYHSNNGATADRTVKPEIIAPAVSIAAPLLPNTEDYKSAEMLEWIYNAPDYKFGSIVFEHWHQANLPERIMYQRNKEAQREIIEATWRERKIVATHYQHVNGTSFAAPIVSSVVAQMLEANPDLSPAAVKNILISTAERIRHFSAERQGYGCLNARRAVVFAELETHVFADTEFSPPRIEGGKILFFYHDDEAQEISLSGDFNDWQRDEIKLKKQPNGFWRGEIKVLLPGKYRYKFVVDKERWTEDASNGLKEADGFGGFNSILHVV
jgi:serine protease AprX